MKGVLPYGEIASKLLDSIFKALDVCCHKYSSEEYLCENDKDISNCYEWIVSYYHSQTGLNEHLRKGFTKKNFSPRLTKLTIQAFNEAQDDAKNLSNGVLLPSPLNILYNALCVPEEPQSNAYSIAICKALLYNLLKVHPSHPDLINSNNFQILEAADIRKSIETFRKYIKINDNLTPSLKNKAALFTAHFLAMKGYFQLRFLKEEKNKNNRAEYLKSCNLNGTLEIDSKNYEFRLASAYIEIPDSSELLNQIWGIPIPIRGAETVLYGGLKTASDSSLVISVSGQAGIGKTSFALALASTLSPFNTITYYLAFEEDPKDLKNRLVSIVPSYLNNLTIYDKEINNWFYADKIEFSSNSNINNLKEYLDKIISITNINNKISENSLPAICPLVIVIDSMTGIMDFLNPDKQYLELENFIKKCRELKALVVLLSGDEIPKNSKLDYLVDVVINLNHQGTEKFDEKPLRVFQLLKTRHQISRPGSHLFHLSGSDGFRISPQIPSQIDRKENTNRSLPDKKFTINTFNILNEVKKLNVLKNDGEKFLDIFLGGQILLHGHGSSGKAGLALKILLSPPIPSNNSLTLNQSNYNQDFYKRRVLVVSFLYPKEYYNVLEKRINTLLHRYYPTLQNPQVDCLYFFPGFITAEDFLSKITRSLDASINEGQPYTGILLDGLHNVFLQFKNLQERDIVWPMLYSLLSRYKLTVVTTFTNFTLNVGKQFSEEDNLLKIKGHTPFLHVLVQATDFYLMIDPLPSEDAKTIKYSVSVKSAIYQKITNKTLLWNREELTLSQGTGFQNTLFDFSDETL